MTMKTFIPPNTALLSSDVFIHPKNWSIYIMSESFGQNKQTRLVKARLRIKYTDWHGEQIQMINPSTNKEDASFHLRLC